MEYNEMPPIDWTNLDYQYNTELSPEEQKGYDKAFPDPQAKRDYDMQGWYKANAKSTKNGNPGVKVDEGTHYPDTWKKPNHPTFSDESIYSTKEAPGGHWDDKGFTPSPSNFKYRTRPELEEYFKRVEPNMKLNALKGDTNDYDSDAPVKLSRPPDKPLTGQAHSDAIPNFMKVYRGMTGQLKEGETVTEQDLLKGILDIEPMYLPFKGIGTILNKLRGYTPPPLEEVKPDA